MNLTGYGVNNMESINPIWLAIVIITIAGVLVRIGIWIGSVNTDRKNFSGFMTDIRGDIKDIREKISGILLSIKSPSITSDSPLRLSELGKRVSVNINAEDWAKVKAREIVEKTRDLDVFQIQELSFETALNFEPEEELSKKMRDSAFKEGINLNDVRKVFAVVLRDELLELHEFKLSELD